MCAIVIQNLKENSSEELTIVRVLRRLQFFFSHLIATADVFLIFFFLFIAHFINELCVP